MLNSTQKKVFFIFISCVIAVITIESMSFITIWFSSSFLGHEYRRTQDIFKEQSERIKEFLDPKSERREVFDSTLGWLYRKNYSDTKNQINSQGLRSNREYSLVADLNTIRVAAFGDSFVYCNEVVNKDSWPALIEDLLPNIEVLNYGIGGYGTDQAYLRYLAEGNNLSPDIVIIGFTPIMLKRNVNVYRRFISDRELALTKPRFVFNNESDLVLVPNPIKQKSDYKKYLRNPQKIIDFGKNDYWYEPGIYENQLYDISPSVRLFTNFWIRIQKKYLNHDRLFDGEVFNRSSKAFEISNTLIEKFVEEVRNSGAIPIVVIFPDSSCIMMERKGQKVFGPLVDKLKSNHIDYVDLTNAFVDSGIKGDFGLWYAKHGHFSPSGNKIIAYFLGKQILARLTKLWKPKL